jgi:hypothetical protein
MLSPNIVPALCLLLGSPSWHTREAAHHALAARPDAVPCLRAAACCTNPEVAGRAQQILRIHHHANADRLTAQITQWPWIDALSWGHEDRDVILSHYLDKGRKAIGWGSAPDWTDYRWATRLYVRDLYRDGANPETVRAMLEQMTKNQMDWIGQSGRNYTPPIEVPLRRE